jgi:membrane-associated phospholipid phosphatase
MPKQRLIDFRDRALPKGWPDAARQLLLFAAAYGAYQLVRGLVNGNDVAVASWNATKLINLERTLHVFVEPDVQAWTVRFHWLIDFADVTYLYSQGIVAFGVLAWIYVRRNDSYYFVRNMFVVAMVIALVGYTVYPTAPPRLMPEWGFTDPVAMFTHVTAERGAGSTLLNLYAAVPSLHVCFASMVGIPMSRFVRHRWAKVLWLCYPLFITFVVVSTGNHYLTDCVLGAATAALSALISKQLLARARPDVWAFRPSGRQRGRTVTA